MGFRPRMIHASDTGSHRNVQTAPCFSHAYHRADGRNRNVFSLSSVGFPKDANVNETWQEKKKKKGRWANS